MLGEHIEPINLRERNRRISTPRFGFIDDLLVRFADCVASLNNS